MSRQIEIIAWFNKRWVWVVQKQENTHNWAQSNLLGYANLGYASNIEIIFQIIFILKKD